MSVCPLFVCGRHITNRSALEIRFDGYWLRCGGPVLRLVLLFFSFRFFLFFFKIFHFFNVFFGFFLFFLDFQKNNKKQYKNQTYKKRHQVTGQFMECPNLRFDTVYIRSFDSFNDNTKAVIEQFHVSHQISLSFVCCSNFLDPRC